MNIEDMDYSDAEQVEDLNERKKAANKVIQCSIAEKDYLTEDEAAAYLGIGKTTLNKWIIDGLVIIKIGGRKLYAKEDIKKFLSAYRQVVEPYQARRR